MALQASTRGQNVQASSRAFSSVAHGRPSRRVVQCRAAAGVIGRRELLQAASAAALLTASPALAAKAPKGFTTVEDNNDAYKFLYPFGWQEVAVKGADVVYKDVVEPLESVSVTLTATDKKDIAEFGDLQTVANTLANDVLSAPGTEVKLINTQERELNGHNYYEIEFTATTSRYTRHQLAVVAANNGTFYTLTTGANERRWNKMKEKLTTTVQSFQLLN
ncbi:PsbP-like protein 1, chloroplastic [Tetrabaena socialis]|uniref:PsbP-like protein 1, chloroplastic n=1 Tax=Tetrabaena socialis TaxID=47790 RepID=A0A2J7ZTF9_9CHLO|nr:PsbP-like protein 1, chloroplastic [Tetrabaena socialis]|eukprot:PNH03538.1 PsbP-like protein 1, chloroplastic [Tetrabaena socialis]